MRRGALFLALWLAVAFVAIATGTWAMSMAGGRDGGVGPLSDSQISDQVQGDRTPGTASGTETPGTPDPSGTPAIPGNGPSADPSDPGGQVGFTSPGGNVGAVCQGGQAYLAFWSPAPGYRADHAVRGPAQVARVEFESDAADDVEVSVRCVDGVPRFTADADPDDHGRRHGGDDDHDGDDRHGGDDNSGPGSDDSGNGSGSNSGHGGDD